MDKEQLKHVTVHYGPDDTYKQVYTVGDTVTVKLEDGTFLTDKVLSIEVNDRLGQFRCEVELEETGTRIYINYKLYLEK